MKKSDIRFSDELRGYLLSLLRETDELEALREETEKDPNAIMQIPPEQGQFLWFLVRAIGAKKAIEIGTYTGYSALCIALALPEDGKLVACDINDEWVAIGRRYWKAAGVEDKIDFRLGQALSTLGSLIVSGEAGSFDFVFIDADKRRYDLYYEKALELLRPGGVIAIDNVFLFGSVVDKHLLDAEMHARINEADVEVMRNLNAKISADVRVDQTMLPLADGLTLVRKL